MNQIIYFTLTQKDCSVYTVVANVTGQKKFNGIYQNQK